VSGENPQTGRSDAPRCVRKRCRRRATEAWDVFSWFKEREKQTPRHYEVCEKHGRIFAGSFDRLDSEEAAEKYVASGAA